MKNFIRIAVIAILALALFCGCADDYSSTEVISDIPEGRWESDPEKHWKTDKDGEIVYSGEHENLDDWVCDICECEIVDWGDGSYNIHSYDGYGNIIKSVSYENGEIAGESSYEYLYNDYGNMLFSRCFDNGVLIEECSYAVDTEGYSVLQESKIYYEDGTYEIATYRPDGDLEKSVIYDENDNICAETIREYSPTADGNGSFPSKDTITDYLANEKRIFEYNEQSDQTYFAEYDLEDNLVHEEISEYEYDDQDRKTYHKTVVNGVLTEEIFFGYHEEEDGWWSYYDKQILYNEDGSYTVYRYDEKDELLSEEFFDASGNKIG